MVSGTDRGNEGRSGIQLGNAHKGIKIVINRMSEVDENYIQQYQSVAPPLLAISKQMQKHLQRIFRDFGYADKQTSLLMGRRIEPRHLMDQEG